MQVMTLDLCFEIGLLDEVIRSYIFLGGARADDLAFLIVTPFRTHLDNIASKVPFFRVIPNLISYLYIQYIRHSCLLDAA